jgi:hypothetical protein
MQRKEKPVLAGRIGDAWHGFPKDYALRATHLYDRRREELSLEEVERIRV